jgi:uncharacterized protein (DUF1810 family)
MKEATDDYDLERFVDAQDPVIDQVRGELEAGRKRTHWMWFVFPQVEGLGKSPKAKRFAISSPDEARKYLEHPTLGPRLTECTEIVNGVEDKTAYEIFGSPDNLKFRSSMTLFDTIADETEIFARALEKYFDDEPDQKTLKILAEMEQEG